MNFRSLLWIVICVQMASVSISYSGIFTADLALGLVEPSDIINQFNLATFAILGTTGTIIGILGALFRQYTYAAGAILIWVIGILLPLAQWLYNGYTVTFGALLAQYGLSWVGGIILAFVGASLFLVLLEVAGGRGEL